MMTNNSNSCLTSGSTTTTLTTTRISHNNNATEEEPPTPDLLQEQPQQPQHEEDEEEPSLSSELLPVEESPGSDNDSNNKSNSCHHHNHPQNDNDNENQAGRMTMPLQPKSPRRRPLHQLPETVHKAQFLAKIKREHLQRCGGSMKVVDVDPTQVLVSILRVKRIHVTLHSYKDLVATNQSNKTRRGHAPFFQHPWDHDSSSSSSSSPPSYPLFDHDLLQAVRTGNVDELRQFLQHRGPPALRCFNRARESLLHVACRRGHTAVVRLLLHEAHVPARVCDDYGRNPLHDACWTPEPNFELVALLLEACPDLLWIQDMRGHTPLRYAPRQSWKPWVKYLARNLPKIVPRFLCHHDHHHQGGRVVVG